VRLYYTNGSKDKEDNLTISERYSVMDDIIDECRKKVSVSDYLCSLAVKDR
jgi:hypothetical protein